MHPINKKFLISGREQIAGTNRDVIFFYFENIGSFRVLSKKKKKKEMKGNLENGF
jgi:hypothetical protein